MLSHQNQKGNSRTSVLNSQQTFYIIQTGSTNCVVITLGEEEAVYDLVSAIYFVWICIEVWNGWYTNWQLWYQGDCGNSNTTKEVGSENTYNIITFISYLYMDTRKFALVCTSRQNSQNLGMSLEIFGCGLISLSVQSKNSLIIACFKQLTLLIWLTRRFMGI